MPLRAVRVFFHPWYLDGRAAGKVCPGGLSRFVGILVGGVGVQCHGVTLSWPLTLP